MGWPKGKPRGPRNSSKSSKSMGPQEPKLLNIEPQDSLRVTQVAQPHEKHPELQSGPAIFGYKILVNRTPEPYVEFMYNGKPFKVETELLLPTEIAYHGMKRTLVRWNPVAGTYMCKLGIKGETDCSPLTEGDITPLELLERTNHKERDPSTGQALRLVYESAPANREKSGRLPVSVGPDLSFGIKG